MSDVASGRGVLDQPLRVGNRTLRSRVYLPAHQPGLAVGGRPEERYIAYHAERARAGVAMQVTGATPVTPSAEWGEICLWNIDESIVPGYQRLAEAVHAEGGVMVAQLAHPGPTEYEGPDVIGASLDFSEVSRQVAVEATAAQLDTVVEQYAAAADRCRRGGLDGVEISMAHGLLLASFLSPLTNRRTDGLGGSLAGRVAFPLRVLAAVREAIGPDLILGVRLGVDDLVEGGLVPETAAEVARELQSHCDYLSVMVGNNNRLEARVRHWPPAPAEPGLFREAARTITHAVDIPVFAVGRVTTAALAADIVASGDADMVGLVRAHIADPELLPKSLAGNAADVRPCIGANVCVNSLLERRPLRCLVNPDAGDPGRDLTAQAAERGVAVVVGGGPAGLEAARRLALIGHRVTLLERADHLGGQFADFALAPSRAEFAAFITWQARQMTALGVDVRLGTDATAESVLALDPVLVVIATGAVPRAYPLAADDASVPVLDYATALRTPQRGRVVVFDDAGELDAAYIAEKLAVADGAEVTLLTSRLHVGEGEGISTLYPMLRRLGELGVTLVDRQRPIAVANGSVVCTGTFGESETVHAADVLVSYARSTPVTQLRDDLAESGIPVHLIGDARRPRRVVDATADAHAMVEEILAASPSQPGQGETR
ncbi:NAD(P)-binding protein [Actinomycetota bacterium]